MTIKRFTLPALLLLAGTIAAFAGNTSFFSSTLGDVLFPFTAPLADGTAGAIDNMIIGAGTPRAGTFTSVTSTTGVAGPVAATTLSASGAVTGTGFTARLATPGPIGNTVASTGAFTTLNASGQITSTAGLPTISSGACGTTTNGAVVAGSTNQAGSITIGAAATTTCTISWSATLASAPKACVFMAMNAAAIAATTLPFVGAPSTTAVVFNGAVLANTNWSYICL